MLRNYLLTAFRSFNRNRLSTFLNIFGLAAGIVSCLFIYLYTSDELSFDKSFAKADRIYRLQCFYKFEDIEDKFGIIPFAVIPNMVKDYPEIEQGARLYVANNGLFKKENVNYEIKNVYLADSNFFNIFDFPFVYGNANSLNAPEQVVLTKTEADKIFGPGDPTGKIIEWNLHPLKVSGVIDDKKINTHIETGAFISMSSARPNFIEQISQNWGTNSAFSYIVLKEGVDITTFRTKLRSFVDKYLLPFWKAGGFNGQIKMFAEPLNEIHFNNYLIYDTEKKGNITYVYIFSIVAIIILTIACINFINLATVTASSRAKEVAMRKVLGSQRRQLIAQFLGEAFITTLFAFILAAIFLEVLLPAFNQITGKEVNLGSLLQSSFAAVAVGLLLFIALIAGAYPAFYISRLPVQAIFRNASTALGKSGTLRKVLVTSQFTLSIAMIIATLCVLGQLNFMRNKNLGFSSANMMVLSLPPGDSSALPALQALKQELFSKNTVAAAARSAQIPGSNASRYVFRVKTKTKAEDKPVAVMFTDQHFLTMMDMKLSAGRFFNDDDLNLPAGAALVNEAAIKMFGWDNPTAENLTIPGDNGEPDQAIKVVGVIKDFHFASMHHPIEPLAIMQQSPKGVGGNLVVQLKGDNTRQAIIDAEDAWRKVYPNKTFEYTFLSDTFRKMYVAEEKMFSIFIYFAALAILLSGLGLYGLSAYTAQQRTKEIGIRKVMGASPGNIVALLNRDFLMLTILAMLISFPLSYYIMHKWLQNFAYHTSVSALFFISAGVLALVITVGTVSFHAWLTAARNPVKSLRYE